jgi:hypothetical protein
MNINDIPGEQYCMNCKYWGKRDSGLIGCTHKEAKGCWFKNQLNGCDYFDGKLEPKKNWNAAYKIGYRPSTFSKGE